MGDLLNNSTNMVMGLLISIVLICSALIPVAIDQIAALVEKYGTDVSQYTGLISTIIIVAIISLLIGIVRSFTKENRVD